MDLRPNTAEVQSALYVAKDQNYIGPDQFKDINEKFDELSRMIQGFINYLLE